MNIFEVASRKHFRFESVRGNLTTEALWVLPLQSKEGFDLDTVAKTVNAKLKSVTEDSFVNTTSNPQKASLEIMLELVKHIIQCRLEEQAALHDQASRKIERDRLRGILAEKEDAALKELSVEEIHERLNKL